jgi:hypothetical protein
MEAENDKVILEQWVLELHAQMKQKSQGRPSVTPHVSD